MIEMGISLESIKKLKLKLSPARSEQQYKLQKNCYLDRTLYITPITACPFIAMYI